MFKRTRTKRDSLKEFAERITTLNAPSKLREEQIRALAKNARFSDTEIADIVHHVQTATRQQTTVPERPEQAHVESWSSRYLAQSKRWFSSLPHPTFFAASGIAVLLALIIAGIAFTQILNTNERFFTFLDTPLDEWEYGETAPYTRPAHQREADEVTDTAKIQQGDKSFIIIPLDKDEDEPKEEPPEKKPLEEEPTEPLNAPTGLKVVQATESSLKLSWDPVKSNVGVVTYNVHRNGDLITTVNATQFTDTGLVPDTAYQYQVSAVSTNDRESERSDALVARTDVRQPTVVAFYNVKTDCGAAGDGIQDDTNAIQECMDRAHETTERAVYFPAGTYYVTRQHMIWDDTYDNNGTTCPYDDRKRHGAALLIPSNIRLYGDGMETSTLTLSRAGSGTRIDQTYILHAGRWLSTDPRSSGGLHSSSAVSSCPSGLTDDAHDPLHGYVANWKDEAVNIEIHDLGFRGQVNAENAAISIYHGESIALERIKTSSFHRGIKIARTTDVDIRDSVVENNGYIGIALYGPHANSRARRSVHVRITDNQVRNTDAFIANEVQQNGYLVRNPSNHFIYSGIYASGFGFEINGNDLAYAGFNLEDIQDAEVTGNSISQAPIAMRVGYINRGAGNNVRVEGNTFDTIAGGIMVNDHSIDRTVLVVKNNTFNSFVPLSYFKGNNIGHGRKAAGINIEDSSNVEVTDNKMHGLTDAQEAGIRISNSALNVDATDPSKPATRTDQRRTKGPLENIVVANNTIDGGANTLGIYARNVVELILGGNSISAAVPMDIHDYIDDSASCTGMTSCALHFLANIYTAVKMLFQTSE